MFEFIFADGNLVFNISLGLMLLISTMEIISVLFGAELSSLIDGFLPDLDLDGGTELIEANALPLLPSALSFFYVGRVPLLILLIIFLTCFGLSGLILQLIWLKITGTLLPVLLSTPIAFFCCLPLQKLLSRMAFRFFPKDESMAVSNKSFLGQTATITIGRARKGEAAEARLTDQFGKSHYVMVEPDLENAELSSGTEVILIEAINSSTFKAIEASREFAETPPEIIGSNNNQKE